MFLLSGQSLFGQAGPAPITAPTDREKILSVLPVVETMLKQFATENHIPGYAFGLVYKGELLGKWASGYANLDTKTPASTTTMFRIASMSKSFTALAILRLRDEGKIKLDDPVATYVPALQNQGLTADAAPITIRDLLTHSAGFPEDNPWGDRQLEDKAEDLLALLQSGVSFSTATGTAYEYSNLGYALLGLIIEKTTGLNYGEYIRTHVWKRLGMQAAWEFSLVPKNQLALGYRWEKNQWVQQPLLHDGIYGAMGGMITSVESFAPYMALHLGAWPPRDEAGSAYFNRSSIREMQQAWRFNNLNPSFKYGSGPTCPKVSAYGYGLRIDTDCQQRTFVGHSGGLPGFGSNWNILPAHGLGVVLLANATYAPTSAWNLRILDTVLALTQLKPMAPQASAILLQRQKELQAFLPHWNGAVNAPIFAENFFPDYGIENLREQCKTIFQALGQNLVWGPMEAENALRG
ncbi:MAG: class A beta-lactamase-related serine hydrolase, partial [Sphingobacteriia bacterium]